MRKGFVRITLKLIEDALKFPSDWKIESMSTVIENGLPIIHSIISGNDFPEESNIEGVPIKECRIIVHKEQLTYEVKELS